MILKVYEGNQEGWCFYDHLRNVAVHSHHIKQVADEGTVAATEEILRGATEEAIFVLCPEVPPDKDKLRHFQSVYADQDGQRVKILFNTTAYLMTDEGVTIEVLQVLHVS
jgi:hypothetical protein